MENIVDNINTEVISTDPERLHTVLIVTFETTKKRYYFEVLDNKRFKKNDRVIVETIRGTELGIASNDPIQMKEKDLVLPIILIIIGFCLMNVLVGFFLYKTTKFSLSTALLSASPGGMSDISLMAEDLGANGPQVASMQFLRAIFIVGVYPIIIKILFT